MNYLPGKRLPQARRRQSGFSMIEVLVTLIILLVGLLGLAGLMVQSQRSEVESYQRVQALVLLQQMAGRINANRLAGATCYAFTSATVANPYPGSPYLGNTSTLTTLATPAPPVVATSVNVPSCTSANVITAYTNLLNVISPQATNPTAYAQYLNSITTVNATTGTSAAQAAAATALADLLAWNNDLLGAAEAAGGTTPGANTGAMVGARGCISYDPNTELLNSSLVKLPGSGVYTLSIAWQGLGDTYANTSLLCGQGQYGPETRRRVVSLTLRIGSVDNNN